MTSAEAALKTSTRKVPEIATSILKHLGCDKSFIQEVRRIIGSHHDHPDNPSLPFRVLYDSDKLVMFSPEEFPYYNSRVGFDWEKLWTLCIPRALGVWQRIC